MHLRKSRLFLQQGQGLQYGNVVFVGGHFRHSQDQKIPIFIAQLPALFLRIHPIFPEPGGIDSHPRDVLGALRVKVLPRPGIVLPVDGDQHIRPKGQRPFRGIKQQPVHQRCALEKVEAVGGVDHLRPLLSGVPGRQPGDHRPHRGMAVDQVVISRIDDGLQHPVGPEVARLPGCPLKGDIIISVTVRDLAVRRIFVVIPGCHSRLPAHLLEHLQIGNMELHHVGLNHRGHKQDFFLCHTKSPQTNKQ